MTKLESFIKGNDLAPMDIVRAGGISRQHLLRMRKGTMDPTRSMMIRVAAACSRLVERAVSVASLFDLAVHWQHPIRHRPEPEPKAQKERQLTRLGLFMVQRNIGTTNLA